MGDAEDEQVRAAYEAGYRDGESNRDADITVAADDWTVADQSIVERLIKGGWTPPATGRS